MKRITIGILVEDGVVSVSSSVPADAIDLVIAYEDHDLNDDGAEATREREAAIAKIAALEYSL